MDYEKKYKEALERAEEIIRYYKEHNRGDETSIEDLEQIFSELKENEDEKIRRNIIAALKGEGYYDCDLTNECIAWVEKQGEQMSTIDVDAMVEKYKQEQFPLHNSSTSSTSSHNPYYYPVGYIDNMIAQYRKGINDVINKLSQSITKISEQKPFDYEHATITQKDFAPKEEPKFKVKYAGNEYNVFEIRNINGIKYYGIEDEPNHIDYIKADSCKKVGGYSIKEKGSPYPINPETFAEQKPTWSDEDEKCLINAIDACLRDYGLSSDTVKWLETLKDRMKGKEEKK